MREVLNKYVFFIACFFVSFTTSLEVVAQPPPDGLTCCDKLLEETGDIDAYDACTNSSNPNAYCAAALPIDNSIYILMASISGGALASFVIYRRTIRKKTPM